MSSGTARADKNPSLTLFDVVLFEGRVKNRARARNRSTGYEHGYEHEHEHEHRLRLSTITSTKARLTLRVGINCGFVQGTNSDVFNIFQALSDGDPPGSVC